jgi:hypothetical protein
MKCHEHEADLVDQARSDAPLGQVEAGLRTHLEGCADCAARFERERQLTAGLRALARQAEVVEANPVAERRLLEMFESDRNARPRPDRSVFWSGRRATGMWALAAAAGFVLCVGAAWTAGLWPRVNGGVGGRASPAGVHAAAPTDRGSRLTGAAAPSADMPPADARLSARPSTARADAGGVRPLSAATRQTTTRASRAPVAEEVEEFVALPAADRLPGFESGMILRVELPVSSLPAYGLEIVPDAARTPVRADVLVGQDGQPRAIRLISVGSGPRRIR